MNDSQNSNNKDLNRQININDIRNYLQYRNDELNKELLEKMNKIYQQNEEIKHLEMTIDNYKKNFQILNEKISKQDNLQVEINHLNKIITDIESQQNLVKMENVKLVEVIRSKDNLISQFENLVTVSTEKFKMFDETHRNLRNENISLKNKIEEQSSKINSLIQKEGFYSANLEETKSSYIKKEKEIERLENEMNKVVEKYKAKIEETETNLKNKLKIREEELKTEYIKELSKSNADIEKLIYENEKIKLETKNLNKQISNLENSLQEKEFEYKRVIDNKDREVEKLSKTIKDLNREIRETEQAYKEKTEEIKSKAKHSAQPDEIYKAYLNSKDKLIFELENEVRKLKHTLEFVTSELKEVEVVIESKENMIKKLKNENSELMKELNKKKLELQSEEDDIQIRLETAETKIKLLEREKEVLFKEKEEDHIEIFHLRSKLTNETKCLMSKTDKLNMNSDTSPIGEHSKYDSNLLTVDKEDQYLAEISRLQNMIMDRDKERDDIKIKFEKRLHSVKD